MYKKKFQKKCIDIIFIVQRTDILGNKDIDHYLPFLYFLNKIKSFEFTARGLIFDNKNNFLNDPDPRTKLLYNLKNVELEFIDNGFFSNFVKKLKLQVIRNNYIFTKFINKILFKLDILFTKKINLQSKLGDSFVKSKKPVIITLLSNRSLKIISDIKKINKFALSVELTHGEEVCDNKMVLDSHLSKDEKVKYNKIYDKIDFFIKTSNRELEDAIQKGMNKKKGIAIGSPRYCKEWLKIKSKLGLDGKNVSFNKKHKVKILFFIPKKIINIFWEELIRTIDFISSYKEFELIIINYNKYFPRLPNYLKFKNNIKLYLISEKYSTSKLIEWADIIFHAGTGIIFEFFMKEKIIVFPKYLTCNTLICSNYNAGYNLNNRDELRVICNKASKSIHDLKKVYKKKYHQNNKKFVNDLVYANTKSIPDNINKALSKIYNLF